MASRRRSSWLGLFEWTEGDLERARPLLEEGVAQARTVGDRRLLALVLRLLSYLIHSPGDRAAARRFGEEALAVRRVGGDKREIAATLYMLARSRLDEEAPEAIEPLLVEGLAVARESGDAVAVYDALIALSWVYYRRGELTRARNVLDESLALARRGGSRGYILWALLFLGDLAAAEQDWAGAIDRYRHVLRMVLDVHRGIAPYVLDRNAAVCAARGEQRRAARLLGATLLARRFDIPILLFAGSAVREEQVAAARLALGESGFAAAWAEGQAMTLEQAVAETMGDEG